MKYIAIVLLACLWGSLSYAQQTTESLCAQLAQYVSSNDVDFQVDADVPADLNEIETPAFDSVSIPVEIDLAEFFDRPDLRGISGLSLEPEISNIEVNQDGSIYYNGHEITADIRQACGQPVAPVKEVVKKPTPSKPKAISKPKPKPVVSKATAEKKSSVRVFNGPKKVIVTEPEVVQKEVNKTVVQEAVKPDKNVIDVEEIEPQNNTDNNDLIEGQYP